MCPALCSNERIIAGMDAFDGRPPERGEVILFAHKTTSAVLVKRVVAVGGDTVAPGPNGTVLVNGNALKLPGICGEQTRDTSTFIELPTFEMQEIPKDSLFVIGDNLNHSLDSRYASFGLVRRDHVWGKALLIYWSSRSSRIGCRIQ
jgi:signal peptidase I